MLRTLNEIFGNTTYTTEKMDDAAWQYTPTTPLNVNWELINRLKVLGWVTTEGIFIDTGELQVNFTQNGWCLTVRNTEVFVSHPSNDDAEALTFPLP